MDRGAWWAKESDTAERLTLSLSIHNVGSGEPLKVLGQGNDMIKAKSYEE